MQVWGLTSEASDREGRSRTELLAGDGTCMHEPLTNDIRRDGKSGSHRPIVISSIDQGGDVYIGEW